MNRILAGLLIAFAVSFFSGKILANWQLNQDSNQYVIVSSRDATQDLTYSLASTDSNGLKYVRSESNLGQGIAESSHASFEKGSLHVALFKNHQYVKLLPTTEGLNLVDARISQVTKSNWSMWAVFAVMIGAGAGLLFGAKREWIAPISASLAVTSLIKAIADCSTCAHTMILGMNAAFVGLCFFGLASWVTVKVKSPIGLSLVALLIGVVPFWQVWESLNTEFCVPCGLIALFSAWVLVSSASWPIGNRIEPASANKRFVNRGVVWAGSALVPLVAYLSSYAAGGKIQASDHGLFPSHNIKVSDIQQLGLKPPHHREVLFVAKQGCQPCEEGLRTVDSVPHNGLTFAFVGDVPPDSAHAWIKVPVYKQVSSTPTLLFVEPSGTVSRQLFGMPSDSTEIGLELRGAQQFVSEIPANAGKGE